MPDDRTGAFSRRGFLKGTAAASLGTAATAAGIRPAAADPIARGGDRTARRRASWPRSGAREPHRRGSLRVHVQEPAAARGLGGPAHRPGSDHGGTAGHRHQPHRPGDGRAGPEQRRQPRRGHQGPQRRPRREPEPAPDVGLHLRRSVHRPRHHLRHHDPQRAAGRSQGHHQLPDAALRPGLHLRAGPQQGSAALRPQRPGQVPDRQASLQRDQGRPDDPRRGLRRAARRQRQGDHRGSPQRPDADPPPAARGPADVPQQARGPRAEEPGVRAVPGAVGVRVGPAPGPVALPVDGDPRLPARHRGQGHGRLGVQGGADRASDHQPQVLPDDQPAGASLHPGGVLGGRVPLRPQHRAAPVHGAGLHRYPDRRNRGRVERPALRGRRRPTTT